MRAQTCPTCGALIQIDGTSPCPCVLIAAAEVDRAFETFRYEWKSASAERPKKTTVSLRAAPDSFGTGRGKRLLMAIAAAATAGTVAFGLQAMTPGPREQEASGPSGPSLWIPPAPEKEADDAGGNTLPIENVDYPSKPGSSDEAGDAGDGLRPAGPPPSLADPAPPPSGNGGGYDGGYGGGYGGGYDGGGQQGGGGYDGGYDGGGQQGGGGGNNDSGGGGLTRVLGKVLSGDLRGDDGGGGDRGGDRDSGGGDRGGFDGGGDRDGDRGGFGGGDRDGDRGGFGGGDRDGGVASAAVTAMVTVVASVASAAVTVMVTVVASAAVTAMVAWWLRRR